MERVRRMTPTLRTNQYRIRPRTTIRTIKRIVENGYPVRAQLLSQYPVRLRGPLLHLQFQEVRYGGPLQPLQVPRGATPLSRTSCPHRTIPRSLALRARLGRTGGRSL